MSSGCQPALMRRLSLLGSISASCAHCVNGLGPAINREELVVSPVVGLLDCCGPPTVAGLVISFVVNPVDLVP
jgi:hypothetical protein